MGRAFDWVLVLAASFFLLIGASAFFRGRRLSYQDDPPPWAGQVVANGAIFVAIGAALMVWFWSR